MNISFLPAQISFSSLKPELELGRKILSEYKKEYPFIKSSSYLNAKADLYSRTGTNYNLIKKLRRKASKVGHDIIEELPDRYFPYEYKKYIEKIKGIVKDKKISNCSEISDLILEKMKKNGIKDAHTFAILPMDKNSDNYILSKQHVFNIFNLKKNYNMENVSSWGNQAVIIDGWMNFVLPVQEGLKRIKSFLNISGEKEKTIFRLYDIK